MGGSGSVLTGKGRMTMPDRELLLERLERLAIVLDELMPQCAELVRDSIVLLKEQEAVEPHSHLTDDADLYFTCGKCGNVIWSEWYKYCPTCGLKVAWNGKGW